MPEDFPASAVRHWRDGNLLQDNGRTANADQLYGFAAECALKSVLILAAGGVDEFQRQHIDVLWDRMPLLRVHRGYPSVVAVLRRANPFADWTTNQRYGADGLVRLPAVVLHRQAAARLLGAVGLTGSHS